MKKITVPVEIEVPDGCEFESIIKTTSDNVEVVYIPIFKALKPSKKVIDLSCIVGSGIDCEFTDNRKEWVVDSLAEIDDTNSRVVYRTQNKSMWNYCRIRQSPHVHFWNCGDKCPLPEGLKLKLHIQRSSHFICSQVISDEYMNRGWGSVIGFEILGPAEGWRYEWEGE